MLTQRGELELASRWGWVVFRGVVAILFGLVAFAEPATVGFALVLIFADQAAHDAYQEHPVHDRFRTECGDFYTTVRIFDSVG